MRQFHSRRSGAIAAWALLAAPAAAQAPASFCGLAGGNVAALHAAVDTDLRYKRDGGDIAHEIWSAESIQAILTFTTAKNAAHPAAVCQQVIDKGGTMQIDRQVRCEGKAAACAALNAADDGPGGGE